MPSAVFDGAMLSFMTGGIALTAGITHVFCILGNISPVAHKSDWSTYSNCKNATGLFELSSTTYPTYVQGGNYVPVSAPSTDVNGVTALKPNTAINNGSTTFTTPITFNWAILQYAAVADAKTTDGNKLLCYLDLGAQSATSGLVTLTWNPAGIITLTT
jgi:hypothetical protein